MMKEWNEQEAYRILEETIEVIEVSASLARESLTEYRERVGDIAGVMEELGEIVTGLSALEISVSRSTPWITRGDARKIISLATSLKSQFDVSHLIKMASEITSQTRTFVDTMNRLKAQYSDSVSIQDEGWEYLTAEQTATILDWIREGRERVEVTEDA